MLCGGVTSCRVLLQILSSPRFAASGPRSLRIEYTTTDFGLIVMRPIPTGSFAAACCVVASLLVVYSCKYYQALASVKILALYTVLV